MIARERIIPGWQSEALNPADAQRKYKQTLSQYAESILLRRAGILASLIIGGVGIAAFLVSVIGWLYVLPLKSVEDHLWLVDKTTGIIAQPVSLADAPTLFNDATVRHYLRLYVTARESWVPEDDRANDYLVKLMSRPDEQARYATWRKSPDSPILTVGIEGHVSIDNFRFHAETPSTWRVQFDRAVWHKGLRDSISSWSAVVDLQWHPELPMRPDDRVKNPGGLQVLNYSHNPDERPR